MYVIETDNHFPLKGSGWYFDSVVDKAIKYNIITKENIKYCIHPSTILKQDNFSAFVYRIYKIFEEDAKVATNGFIGMLGIKNNNKAKHFYETTNILMLLQMRS